MTPEELPTTEPSTASKDLTPFYALFIIALILIGSLMVAVRQGDDDDGEPNTIDASAVKYRSTQEVTPKERQGEMMFDVTINTTNASDSVKLWLPYPTSNDHQDIDDVQVGGNFDYSAVLRDSESGTVVLYAEWEVPLNEAQLTLSFDITRQEIIRKNFPLTEEPIPVDVEKYMLPSPSVPINGTVAKEVEKAITSETHVLTKAIAIYDHIINNGVRDPTIVGCGDGDPCDSIEGGISGKCADIHSVFVAMARSAGIPAREIFGTRISKNGDITGNFHCRAEFYLPGYGWVPVDPSDVRKAMLKENLTLEDARTNEVREYYFGAQTETYVDFYSGRDLSLNPEQTAGLVNYLMYPYAEIDGVKLDHLAQEDLQYTVTFQEQT